MVCALGALCINPSPTIRSRFRYELPFTFNPQRSIPLHKPCQVTKCDGSRKDQLGSLKKSNLARNLLDNFLPLALTGGVVAGLLNPTLGCLAAEYNLSRISTFGIFLISGNFVSFLPNFDFLFDSISLTHTGLTLHSDEIRVAAEAWPVAVFGLASILLLTPFFSKIIMLLRLQPQEFVTGLAIFSCMPTTLSSGVALTRLAGGNSALALGMTVVSNLLGILTVPFSITKFIAVGVGVSIPAKQLLRNLIVSLLVPLIIGKVLRESFKGLSLVADQNRKLLSIISAILLSLVPWIQVSKSRSLLLSTQPTIFLVAVAMGALLHVLLLAFNALAIQILSAITGGKKSAFARKDNAIALQLVASQKTLPVMVAVVEQLGGAFGEPGLLVVPCVAAHLNQIIIDSFLVGFWSKKEPEMHNAEAA